MQISNEMATSASNAAHREVIKFCTELGLTPTETHKKLKLTESHKNVSRSLVFKWHKLFSEEYEDNAPGKRGRPKEMDDQTVKTIDNVIREDRRRTVREMEEILGISKSSIHPILSDNLGMHRVCARWVPRLLKVEEKQKRISCSKEFLRRLRSGQEEFLNRIITTDETWLHYYDPEGKRESSVWKTPGTPPPKKAKVSRSAGKHMFIMFMDRNGMLLTHAVPAGQTVNAAYYSKVVRRDLMHAIRKKEAPASRK